jgi:hypothetical protein
MSRRPPAVAVHAFAIASSKHPGCHALVKLDVVCFFEGSRTLFETAEQAQGPLAEIEAAPGETLTVEELHAAPLETLYGFWWRDIVAKNLWHEKCQREGGSWAGSWSDDVPDEAYDLKLEDRNRGHFLDPSSFGVMDADGTLHGVDTTDAGIEAALGMSSSLVYFTDPAIEAALAQSDVEAGDRTTFGGAIALMKRGRKMRRVGWNGKGMFVVYQKGYPDGIGLNENTAAALGLPVGTKCIFQPYLMMRTADGSFVTGWLASQTDMLAEDWVVAVPPVSVPMPPEAPPS